MEEKRETGPEAAQLPKGSRRQYDQQVIRRQERKRRIAALLMALLALPGVFVIFVRLLGGRHYLLVSFLVLLLILGMFLIDFEYKRPKARDIVILAVMTAICVAANEICSHTVPLHAGTAMVVITGAALGPEAGFLVGALARLLCNFFAGQGTWTPWEMVAWGLLGLTAGLAFNRLEVHSRFGREGENQEKKRKRQAFLAAVPPLGCVLIAWLAAYMAYLFRGEAGENFFGWRLYLYGIAGLLLGCALQRRKLPADSLVMAAFTFIMVFLLYGGLMNLAGMFMQAQAAPDTSSVSWEALCALYLTGVPYDLMHAGTAAFCVLLFGDTILEKLRRIQIKYGIFH